jgi:hypothetical protein
MRTVKLNTGVLITFDDKDNMLSVVSPYDGKNPFKMTILRYYIKQIKKLIS